MDWLALSIGNSRLHWAWFQDQDIKHTWDTQHLQQMLAPESAIREILPTFLRDKVSNLPIVIASVVPQQTLLWQNYPHKQMIILEDIPLSNLYSTLGIDRALAVWGAGITYGFPCLVIDAGTAMTFTGVDANKRLVGGAILPGLNLQFQVLAKQTAALPEVILSESLPNRWSLDTSTAIKSGIIYTVLAGISNFIQAWEQEFPKSAIALTGGDANRLINYLQLQDPILAKRIKLDPNLIFLGMRSLIIV